MPSRAEHEDQMAALSKTACKHLSSMVVGALREGQMPPRHILEWFIDYNLTLLLWIEQEVMDAGSAAKDDAELGATLERQVVTIAELLRICDANDLLVFKEKITSTLNARRLRLPPAFDHTYDGLLRG